MPSRFTAEQDAAIKLAETTAARGRLARQWGLDPRVVGNRHRYLHDVLPNKKPRVIEHPPMRIASRFARPAWFEEDVVSMARSRRV